MIIWAVAITTIIATDDRQFSASPRKLVGEGITTTSCTGNSCINDELWQCWYGYNGERPASQNNCRFSFHTSTGRQGWTLVAGLFSKMSFCATDTNGQRTACSAASSVDTKLDLAGGSCWTELSPTMDTVLPPVTATIKSAFSLTACYCPNVNSDNAGFACDRIEDYTVTFGRIHVWIAKICDYDNVDGLCSDKPYMRVFPHQLFSLLIECPQDACLSSTDNRVKYIEHDTASDRPNWPNKNSERNACAQSSASPNVQWLSSTGAKDGGALSTQKRWKQNQVRVSLPLRSHVDICFCNSGCDENENYFKVGELRTADTFSFASKQSAAVGARAALNIMMKPGTLTFFGGISATAGAVFNPRGGNKWSQSAAIKVLSLDRLRTNGWTVFERNVVDFDSECATSDYQNVFWHDSTGPTSDAHHLYNAYPSGTWDGLTPSQYLAFSGAAGDMPMVISMAGTYAVCYCAVLESKQEGECIGDWIYASQLVIRGPVARKSPFYSGFTFVDFVQYRIPTGVVFDLELEGYAFDETDKLRLVSSTTQCDDAVEHNPDGLTAHYKIGCPEACQFAAAKQNIDILLMSAVSTGVMAVSVEVFEKELVITFDGNIVDYLVEGDTLTFSRESVKVIDNDSSAWDDYRLFHGSRFIGIFEYPDDPTQTYLIPNIVRYQRNSDGSVVPNTLLFNYGYTDAELQTPVQPNVVRTEFFRFVNNEGMWTRRNKLTTKFELKAATVVANQNLCWGQSDAFYAKAAEISFVAPATMDASISFITYQEDVIAPVVLSFTIAMTHTQYFMVDGVLELVIRFKDTQGKLQPRLIQATPTNFVSDKDTKTQDVCGIMFAELWSNDDEGFPAPEYCYFSSERKDVEAGSTYEREFVVRFFANNKLKYRCQSGGMVVDCQYQLVVHATANGLEVGDHIADAFVMCRGCTDGNRVLDYGKMLASSKSYPKSTLSRFNDQNGITIADTADGNENGFADLTTLDTLEMKLKGQDHQFKIKGGSLLRVFMMPLTQWTLEPGPCGVECIPAVTDGSASCKSVQLKCATAEVVVNSTRFNFLEVTFPEEGGAVPDFTPITSQEKDQHSIRFLNLRRPSTGLFATTLGVEVRAFDSVASTWHPHYMETDASVRIIKQVQPSFSGTGRIVHSGKIGSGSDPFLAQPNNVIFVSIRFPATMLGSENGQFSIVLPGGFSCTTQNDAAWQENELPMWLIQDNTLNQKDYALGTHLSAGSWTHDSDKCIYTLPLQARVHAKQIFLFKLFVTNMGIAMPKTDPLNVWQLMTTAQGELIISSEFLASSEVRGKWGRNIAVLDKLEQYSIQPAPPSDGYHPFTVSSSFFVNVFFRTRQSTGQFGYIVLDAPQFYSFGDPCLVNDLDDAYYAFQADKNTQVKRVMKKANVHECSSFLDTHGMRLKIRVGGFVMKYTNYGFQVRVIAPPDSRYSTTQHAMWFLWTMDATENAIDGTLTPMRFNPGAVASDTEFFRQGFGLYATSAPGITISMSDVRPHSTSQVDAWLSVMNLSVTKERTTTFRATLPIGYEWRYDDSTFFERPTTTQNPVMWPTTPTVYAKNTITFPSATLSAGNAYQFRMRIRVPEKTPSSMTNALFLEFGYDGTVVDEASSQRFMSSVLALPAVKVIVNANLGYMSNVRGLIGNELEFTLETVSAINGPPGGIGVQGMMPYTVGFTLLCPQTVPKGAPPMPAFDCRSTVDAVTNVPTVSLKLTSEALPVGKYRFVLLANHPEAVFDKAGTWSIGTYADVVNFNSPIDTAVEVDGFTLNNPMPSAGFLPNMNKFIRMRTQRDDRPGESNNIIFNFTLSRSAFGELTLRGPSGFYFADNCIDTLETGASEIFGPDSLEDFDRFSMGAYAWPRGSVPSVCTGTLNVAKITIPDSVEAEKLYIFRIGVLANPTFHDPFAVWSIEMGGESSAPFPSFKLWTFSDAAIVPVATTAGSDAPVEIYFTPYNEIPYGGIVQIIIADGFFLLSEKGRCAGSVYSAENEEPIDFRDYKCEVLSDGRTLLLYSTNSLLKVAERNKRHRLVVRVQNPPNIGLFAGVWRITSYTAFSSVLGKITFNELFFADKSDVVGYSINEKMTVWKVCQTEDGDTGCDASKRNGLDSLEGVIVAMQFPYDVKPGQVLIMQGPKGFNFAPIGVCSGFRWANDADPFTNVNAECYCTDETCFLQFVLDAQSLTLVSTDMARFKLNMNNPRNTPDVAYNFWQMTHWSSSGLILARASFEGWDIVPQLEFGPNDISISGAEKSAQSKTSLSIRFGTVASARSVRIQVLEPANFNFEFAVLGSEMSGSGFTLSRKNTTANMITVFGKMSANTIQHFIFDGVVLGDIGGTTTWMFHSFVDLFNNPAQVTNERLNFIGFRLPGKIDVMDKSISSMYSSNKAKYPVKSLLQVRTNEEASLEFLLKFSYTVFAHEKLRITCEGTGLFELKASPFVIIGMGQVEAAVEITNGTLVASLLPRSKAGEVAFEADTPYQIIMKAIPYSGSSSQNTRWRFETLDGGFYPTNTNDGVTRGFSAVSVIDFSIGAASRSPPGAEVEVIVTLRWSTNGTKPTNVMLIAPVGFSFPFGILGCGVKGISCFAGIPFGTTDQKTAEVPVHWNSGDSFSVIAVTPLLTPDKLAWYAVAMFGDEVIGWGEGAGFPLNQMRNVEIIYPAIEGRELQIVVISFTTSNISHASQILVSEPFGFILYCAESAFKQISLPGIVPDCMDRPLTLTLNEDLQPDTDYAFQLGIDTSSRELSPEENVWNIIIKDINFVVVDARYGFPGPDLIPFTPFRTTPLPVQDFTLAWPQATPGSPMDVTVGISFTDDTPGVAALLLELPVTLEHNVKSMIDAKVHPVENSPLFPLAPDVPVQIGASETSRTLDTWLDYSNPHTLQIIVEQNQRIATIPTGTYSWSFAVKVPACSKVDNRTYCENSWPQRNFWALSLCSDVQCDSRHSKFVFATFPMAGFFANEVGSLYEVKNIAWRSSTCVAFLVAIVLL